MYSSYLDAGTSKPKVNRKNSSGDVHDRKGRSIQVVHELAAALVALSVHEKRLVRIDLGSNVEVSCADPNDERNVDAVNSPDEKREYELGYLVAPFELFRSFQSLKISLTFGLNGDVSVYDKVLHHLWHLCQLP